MWGLYTEPHPATIPLSLLLSLPLEYWPFWTKNVSDLGRCVSSLLCSWSFPLGPSHFISLPLSSPKQATDDTFLEKLDQRCAGIHPHYESRALKALRSDQTMDRDQFRLVHYAGNVSWTLNYSPSVCFPFHLPIFLKSRLKKLLFSGGK